MLIEAEKQFSLLLKLSSENYNLVDILKYFSILKGVNAHQQNEQFVLVLFSSIFTYNYLVNYLFLQYFWDQRKHGLSQIHKYFYLHISCIANGNQTPDVA